MQQKLEQWINWIGYDELLATRNNAPQHLLGLHEFMDGQVITVFRPEAHAVTVTDMKGRGAVELSEINPGSGFFGKFLTGKKIKAPYQLHIEYGPDNVVTTADPYCFTSIISDMDRYLFAEGKHLNIYEKLGAHPMTINGVKGTHFAVWAPHAREVSVVGDFNLWDARLHQMMIQDVSGIYELFIPDVKPGAVYKYQILTRNGDTIFKADPYANEAQLRPDNASVVADLTEYKWKDAKWISERHKETRSSMMRKPMSIYECHLGSWKKKVEDDDNGFFSYRELAPEIAKYLNDMGYTHIELMGISEHPFDGSWGYQVTGYFAPTRRYGEPEDFMYFVDYMHEHGIGVILDWVPAHFPRDEFGLGRFDGQALYEHPDPRRGEHPDWGTYIFNYGKHEVSNFLLGSALFWSRVYHVDGLRVDAVASMLYLDYGKQDGAWLPNEDGGNSNYDAINFFHQLNQTFESEEPGTMIIAEESTSWAGVTAPVSLNGLGFLFKWNMGWMNDFLTYMHMDPYFRGPNHNMLTFSMQYAYSENFIQVLSHDEVVHMKGSMIEKMPGNENDKFANLRLAYGFMWGHPGKKLLFMGQEFAQYREWSEKRSLDWFVLSNPKNQGVQNFVKALNHLYDKYDAFWVNDFDPMGFEWMSCDRSDISVVSFVRRGSTAKDQLLFICNFTPVQRDNMRFGVPCLTRYEMLLTSDDPEFGGWGIENSKVIESEDVGCDDRDYSFVMNVPPLSITIFRYDYTDQKTLDRSPAADDFTVKMPEKEEESSEKEDDEKAGTESDKEKEPVKEKTPAKRGRKKTGKK
ncbi:MAG: 1,4-alpha-glucan branching protein GlgB [Lachnospiraceae bacterium]|nr:1,4-alpha-glucan branching protein GlgB [Lachnospiraceae bacterium]MEE3460671.1 1,4-alpha-glucan branching protein GlgB [Lachnospiraceae bacterium]